MTDPRHCNVVLFGQRRELGVLAIRQIYSDPVFCGRHFQQLPFGAAPCFMVLHPRNRCQGPLLSGPSRMGSACCVGLGRSFYKTPRNALHTAHYFNMAKSDLQRSHDDLRAALLIAGKEIRKLNFGRTDTPVLNLLRRVLREARAAAKAEEKKLSVPSTTPVLGHFK